MYREGPRAVETYLGGSYRLIRRDIARFDGIRRVYVWEILTGPGAGDFGGKCTTKAEARAAVRRTMRAYREEK